MAADQPVAEEHDDALLALEPLLEIAWREALLTRVHVDGAVFFEQRERGGRQAAGHENGGAHEPILVRGSASIPHGRSPSRHRASGIGHRVTGNG